PVVQTPVARTVSRPAVASKLRCLSPVFRSAVVGEREGVARRTARHLPNLRKRPCGRLSPVERHARFVAGKERKLRKIVHSADVVRTKARSVELLSVVGHMSPSVIEQLPQLGALERAQFIRGAPLSSLETPQVLQGGSSSKAA